MRFLRITYQCFGPFWKKDFDLSAGQEGVHLFYGPNEAGKSTALRGVRYLLFGFPPRHCEDFRYPAQKQQLEAHLRRRSGEELQLIRVRSRNPLRRPDGEILPEEELRRFLGGLSEEQFQMLFGLDHHLLVEGGRQIVEGKGTLGEALFAAGAGMAKLRKLQTLLTQKAKSFYSPQARSRTKINPLLSEIQQKRDQEQKAILRIETWQHQVDEQQKDLAEKQRLETHRQEVRQEISRLKTYQGLLPTIRQFQQRTQDIQQLPTRDPILDEQETIRELSQHLGACLKAQDDRRRLAAKRELLRNQALGILRTVFGREVLEEVDQLCPSETVRTRIRTLAQQYQARREAQEKAQQYLQELTDQIADCQRRLAEFPPLSDVAELQTCYEAVLQEGPLEKNLRDTEEELEELLGQTDLLLAALRTCWEGSLEEAADLRPPPEERIGEYQKKFEALEQDRRAIQQKIEECDQTIRSAQRTIQQLEKGGEIPSEQALQQARTERNTLLALVQTPSLPPDQKQAEALLQKYAPGGNLFDALKHSIDRCDLLADRLRQEAQRVAQWEHQLQRRSEAEDERKLLEHKLAQVQNQWTTLQQDWMAEWTPWNIRPKSPPEMAAWRRTYDQLRTKIPTLRKLRFRQSQLQEQIASCGSRLQAALGLDSSESKSLLELCALAKHRLEEVQSQTNQRQAMKVQLQELERQRQKAEQECDSASRRLQQWTADWQEAICSLSVSQHTLPEKVQHLLDQLDEILSLQKEANALEERIAGIDRDTEEFLHRLNQVRARLDPGCPESTLQTMQADLDALEARLHRAYDVENHRRTYQKELEDLRSELFQHAGGKPLEEFCTEILQQAQEFPPRLAKLQQQENELDAQIAQLSERLGRAAKQLEDWQLADNAAAQYRQERISLISQLRDLLGEYAAYCAAQKILSQAVDNFRQRHQHTMLSRAAEYFRLLTCGAFTRLEIDEADDGHPTLKAVRPDPDAPDKEQWVPMEGLSDGSRDQLFLALRLAGIEEHATRSEPMPVLIDDALVNFDNPRTAAALKALAELSKKTQVLLFTHHEHIVQLAKTSLAPEELFCYEF